MNYRKLRNLNKYDRSYERSLERTVKCLRQIKEFAINELQDSNYNLREENLFLNRSLRQSKDTNHKLKNELKRKENEIKRLTKKLESYDIENIRF